MAVPGANAQVASGSDLTEITTGSLGFKTIAGEVKLQLPIKWNSNSLPPTSSSLLAVSSAKGLLAAAGEEGLFLASTDNIRAAFKKSKSKDEIVKITPDFALPLPRLSHVCFTSDGSCLVLAAEQGGGLAVHSSQALLSKQGKPAFELPTEGLAVKALVPNPEVPHLVAIVLSSGYLMVANLEERSFARGVDGVAALKDGVACVAWSVRGKQLVAGLQDGTAVQIDPTGAIKAVIPRAPDAPSDQTISTILWLGNDDFFLVYSTLSPEADRPPESYFYWLRTDKGRTKFEFRKAPDPSFAIHTRSPVSHFTARIRKWSQLDDIIFTACTASSDIGTVTNSQIALTSVADQNEITNSYTVTTMEDDSRRATLPMSLDKDDMQDTFPIGMALDLSSKDKVYQPIPGDDTITGDSPNPLPALLVLNQEGILSYWWFINDAAVRNGDPCPGLIAVEGNKAAPFSPTAAVSSPPTVSSPFAAPKLNLGSLTQPSAPAFGQSTFGQKPAAPSFGGASTIGNSQSPWSTGAKPATPAFGQSTFGQPAFGATSVLGGNAFGGTRSVGREQSTWGASSRADALSPTPASPFGSLAGDTSGFAKLGASTASPFGGLGNSTASSFAQAQAQPTPFGNTPLQSFGSTVSIDSNTGGSTITGKSLFGTSTFPSTSSTPQTSSVFGQKTDQDMAESNVAPSPFSTPFKLGSTFAAAESAKELDMEDEPAKPMAAGLDLGSLGQGLSTPVVKEDPEAPKKSLFDLPPLPEVKSPASQVSSEFKNTPDDTTDIKKSIEEEPQTAPEPPQVTSKPIPSPLTTATSSGTNSLQSSSALEKEQEAANEEEEISHPESEASEDVDTVDEDDENQPPASPQISEPPSVTSTPPREELESPELTAQSLLGSAANSGWKEKFTRTPLVSSPLAQKTVAGLREQPTFGSSPGIPPPAPTPPITGTRPRGLFNRLTSNSTTPQGLPQPPFKFPPPNQHESPRSPSPIRQPINGTGVPVRPFQVTKSEFEPEEQTQEIVPVPQTPSTEAFISSLRDQHHDHVKELLDSPPSPVLDLPPFLSSHRDQADLSIEKDADPELDGLPGNIERVYRDINSMIDTLGLNARALAGFVKGHEIFAEDDKENAVDRVEELLHNLDMSDDEDLGEKEIHWCLDDLGRFPIFETRLEERLATERTLGLVKIIGEAGSLAGETRILKSDVKKMRAFLAAKRQLIIAKDSPAKKRNGPLAPVPMDPTWSAMQRNLRTKLASLRAMLADAEEKLTVLRAKIASQAAGKGRGPTVEAVEATVRRMTSMAEKRSGDIDVLEMQMRKLGLVGAKSKPAWKRASGLMESGVGKTFGLDEESEDDEKELSVAELEMRNKVRRCLDVRARRKLVLEKLREGVWKAQGLSA